MNRQRRHTKVIGFPLEARFTEEGYELVWDSRIQMSAEERRFFCNYLSDKYTALMYFGAVRSEQLAKSAPSLRVLHSLSVNFLRMAVRFDTADELKAAVQAKISQILPQIQDPEKMPPESLKAVYGNLMLTLQNTASGASVSDRVRGIYAESLAAMSICFSLEERPDPTDAKPFVLIVTCNYEGRDVSLREAASMLGDEKRILPVIAESVKQAAFKSALINNVYNSGNILDSLPISFEDMHTFLKELGMYSELGIVCRIPNRWRKRRSAISLGIALGNHAVQLGADTILNFDINISIDGEKLTPEEIEQLMSAKDGLILFRNKWVELKRSEMRSCLTAYETLLSAHSDGISFADAMRAFLSPASLLPDPDDEYDVPDIELENYESLIHAGDNIQNDEQLFDVESPSEFFTAVLRPYQADGVRWLNRMRRMGLGACLSDDMGLGKTVQAIAVLEQIRHAKHNKSLIVIPASLLKNWQDELKRFAPYIKYRVLHSSYGNMDMTESEETDVFITTYAMLSRLPKLKSVSWECIILDEAQAIKNPQTLQSKAAKQLSAKFRVAMTGTPIENSVTDLLSIFDFLNPALFRGSINMFADVSDTDRAGERLRKVVRPFILRRLKTDKSIISDLPEKIEMKSYCHLTQRQAVLYKQITDALSDEIRYMNGMERRGLVLSSILRLKQICNHPDQYSGNGAYVNNESGKFMRLTELCNDIKARNERVLIFTQFKEMCEPLFNTLRELFGKDGLIIHGSTSVKERGRIVESFNDPDEYIPFIVLSLRAGGVGLNLTAANHVIHFDRWWNPAVENQATDRAFRIGQTSNVIVHKLICTGTLEEKIDKLIESKSAMATDIVENDVKLTELSNQELLSLLHMDF